MHELQRLQTLYTPKNEQNRTLEPSTDSSSVESLTASDLAEYVLEGYPGSWEKSTLKSPVWKEVQEDHTELGTFEIWSTDTTPPPLQVTRSEALGIIEWMSSFSHFSGKLVHKSPEEIKARIMSGGLDENTRGEGWRFLLGIYNWDSTTLDRKHQDSVNLSKYSSYLNDAMSKVEAAGKNTSVFENVQRIEKDVVRTDRMNSFYPRENYQDCLLPSEQIEANSKLKMLKNILVTYTMHFPCDFVQGMADIASVFLITLKSEFQAFWCFAALMNKLKSNFREDGLGIKQDLNMLRKLIKVMDFPLYTKLEEIDSLHLFCSFRWILVWFRREFSLEDTQILWDYLFCNILTEDLHIFVSLAILEINRSLIFNTVEDSDELLKFFNSLAGKLNLSRVLIETEELRNRYKNL